MPRPRVAFDVGSQLGPLTGVGQAVRHLQAALEHLDGGPELLPYSLSFRSSPPSGARRLPFPAAAAHRWWSRSSTPLCDKHLGNPDVVHGTNYVVPPSRAARLVSVYDCWFLLHPDDVHPDVNRASKVLRRAVSDGATVHASSHATADSVRKLLGTDRIEIIPLGAIPVPAPADDAPRPSVLGDGPPFVVAIGTIEQRKNFPRLIEAFGLAASTLDSIRLVIVGGGGNDSAGVAAALNRLPTNVRERVTLTGRVSDDDRAWLLHHAVALAYPSLDEGFGFPLLEGMAAGIPVVSTTAGSIPEVAGRAALLVDPYDTISLADALTRVVVDSATRATLVVAGHERVRAHSWADTASAMSALYQRLADGAKAAT